MANVSDLIAARRAKLARASRVSRLWTLVVGHLPGSRLPLEYPVPAKAVPAERPASSASELASTATEPAAPDEIDITSQDSFPASDPPAWTSTRA